QQPDRPGVAPEAPADDRHIGVARALQDQSDQPDGSELTGEPVGDPFVQGVMAKETLTSFEMVIGPNDERGNIDDEPGHVEAEVFGAASRRTNATLAEEPVDQVEVLEVHMPVPFSCRVLPCAPPGRFVLVAIRVT